MIKSNCVNLYIRPTGHGEGDYACRIESLRPDRDCSSCLSYKDRYENSDSANIIEQMRNMPMKS